MFLLLHRLPWIHSSKEFHKPAWIIWYLLPPTAAVPGRLLLLHSKTILGDVNGCWLLHPRSFTELIVEEVHVQALLWHFRRFLTVQLVWEPLSQFSTSQNHFLKVCSTDPLNQNNQRGFLKRQASSSIPKQVRLWIWEPSKIMACRFIFLGIACYHSRAREAHGVAMSHHMLL